MVRHLLEREHVPIDDLFKNTHDEKALAQRTLAALE
jgi:hypothetical protein